MARVYLGLGSNLGDRAANLWEAVRGIHALTKTHVVALSPLYETEPVGPVPQDWYLNGVVAADTSLTATELLAGLQGIEKAIGRVPSDRWGPRLIDVDILLYGEERVQTSDLVIPHPELWNRRFALIPLLDVLGPGLLATQAERRLAELEAEGAAVRAYFGPGAGGRLHGSKL